MPLSEQEQRLLDEMERNLYQNDADFVATVGSHRDRVNYRGIVIGAVIVVAGVITLLVGVAMSQSIVGVLGFIVMFAGVFIALSPARNPRRSAAPTRSGAQKSGQHKQGKPAGFMDSLNARWERRQDGRDT
jgi:Flp pilus assembly protein TadB